MTFPRKIGVWTGGDLSGEWQVTYKIDGVRAIFDPLTCSWMSRALKPLYNIPQPEFPKLFRMCELYLGNLKDTVRACRTQHLKADTPVIYPEHLYDLDPLDARLNNGWTVDPTGDHIRTLLADANAKGYEGLVLRQGDTWLKVKPADTLDLRVTGYEEGKGKHKGRLGYLITSKGKVGTGFSDAERQQYWNHRARLIGITIEVECMQMTPDGKMRHSRFIRERFDKIATE